MQLQGAYDSLLAFISTTRQKLLERAGRAEAMRLKGSPKSHPRSSNFSSTSQLSMEAQGAMSQLKQVSLLSGAFCRRVEHVLRTTYLYADVDEAAVARGPASMRVSACMAELARELHLFDTPALNKFLALLGPAEASTWTGTGTAPVDCALSYATGDLNDYRLYRRIRARDHLQQLLAQTVWNTAEVAQVIVALNETLSTPLDTFDLCSSDDAVEATCVVTPLRDPISQTVIRIPARGAGCVHLDMFDVESFVQATQQRSLGTVDVGSPCPLCNRFVSLSALRVDRRAMEAMQQYTKAADAPPLSVDCALEWNTERQTVAVMWGRRAAQDSATSLTDGGEDGDTPTTTARRDVAEAATKKRRIEIGGHVLYAD